MAIERCRLLDGTELVAFVQDEAPTKEKTYYCIDVPVSEHACDKCRPLANKHITLGDWCRIEVQVHEECLNPDGCGVNLGKRFDPDRHPWDD